MTTKVLRHNGSVVPKGCHICLVEVQDLTNATLDMKTTRVIGDQVLETYMANGKPWALTGRGGIQWLNTTPIAWDGTTMTAEGDVWAWGAITGDGQNAPGRTSAFGFCKRLQIRITRMDGRAA